MFLPFYMYNKDYLLPPAPDLMGAHISIYNHQFANADLIFKNSFNKLWKAKSLLFPLGSICSSISIASTRNSRAGNISCSFKKFLFISIFFRAFLIKVSISASVTFNPGLKLGSSGDLLLD